MFCGKCGVQNPDENGFCASCGAPLRQGVIGKPTSQSVPYGGTIAGPVKLVEQNWSDRVRQVLAEYFKSPIFLISVICYTLIQLMNLLGEQDSALVTLNVTLSEMEESSFLEFLAGMKLLTALPGILVSVGLWITYVSAINCSAEGINPVGLIIVRVVHIVIASVSCVAMVISLISVISLSSEIHSDSASAAFGTIIFIMFLALVFVGVYYSLIISSLEKVVDTIRTGVLDSGVSMGLAVILFISGGFSLTGMMTMDALLQTEVLGTDLGSLIGTDSGVTLMGLLRCAMPVIWGVGICIYRSTIGRLEGEAYQYRRAEMHPSATASAPVQKNYVPAWKRVQDNES